MSLPAARHPAPALPMALAVRGGTMAVSQLALNWLRVASITGHDAGIDRNYTLIGLGANALAIGAGAVAALSAVALVRARRSPGGALAAAAQLAGVAALVAVLVATWIFPYHAASRGWRYQAIHLGHWVVSAGYLLTVVGLAAAAWDDRSVRLAAPAGIGASLLAVPPPPLIDLMYRNLDERAVTVAGDTLTIDETRLWLVPVAMAAGQLTWAAAAGWLAHRQPRIPADAMAPRPPGPALRAFALSLLGMAGIAIAAGLVIAVVQGRPASETGPLGLIIPIAVGGAAAAVGAALLWITVTDVSPAASRRFGGAAILVLWCVAVVAAQTLWSQRPSPSGLSAPQAALMDTVASRMFTVFEPPWMPGMVGAVVAVGALLLIAGGLTAAARGAGQPPGRLQLLIVVLALCIGAATVPWLLGFGTRTIPLDGLRIATLGSATLVNLAAWIALARAAWRTAAAFSRRAA